MRNTLYFFSKNLLIALMLFAPMALMGQISTSERYRISENGYSMQPSSEGSNISTSNVKPDHPSDIWRFEGTEYANVYVVKNCYTGKTLVLNKVGWSSASFNKVLAELQSSPSSSNYFIEMKAILSNGQYFIYPNATAFPTTKYSFSPRDCTHTSDLKSGLIVLIEDDPSNDIHASRWTVTPVTVAVPTFEYNTPTGKVTLKHPEAGYATLYRGTASGSVNTAYTEPFSWTSGRVYAQARLRDSNGTAIVSSDETSYTPVNVETPVITVTGDNAPYHVTITCATSGARIYYAINGVATPDSPEYPTGGFDFNDEMGTITAIAVVSSGDNRSLSDIAEKQIKPTQAKDIKDCDDLSGMESTGVYIIINDIEVDENCFSSIASFSGTLEAMINPATNMPYRIIGLKAPLFTTLTGTVKNLVLEGVNISGHSGNTGAIACTANSSARIYNVGILSGSVGGTANTGGLVGLLDGTARVINCYSYATITGGSNVGGIVGYNNATTTAASINTMVMNCMFYGDITGGTTVSPIYGGNNIANLQGGLSNFNYYSYENLHTKAISSNKYNCALAVEEKYLNRFEFYRLLLNSNKKLASFYATGSVDNAEQKMAKWVLETADRTIANPYPYPILKSQGKQPSIINIDAEHANQLTLVNGLPLEADRNKGGKIGTLSVNISNTKTDGGQTWPTCASITTANLNLPRTDKDFDRFNYNYDKVQLPYYNDVGEGNYTGNRVVTGWKITAITAVPGDPYTANNYNYSKVYASNPEYFDYPNYNYANRKSSNKDLYTVSGRVFSQGAYFDVPYGVTSITIEPYWAKAAYVSDVNYDVVYKNDYSGKQNVSQTGTQVSSGATFNGEASQLIKTSVSDALSYISGTLGGYGSTVYDNAVVLVGNLHLDGVPSNGTNPFTMMSVDMDNDHEPDYSLIYHHKGRSLMSPIRFDFLNVIGTAQAQKPNGASLICNMTICKTRGWFEITNTAYLYFSQFEYENLSNKDGDNSGKVDAPLILQGGVIDQFVSTQSSQVKGKVIFIHVGSNVWMHEFGMGTHSDGSQSTPHVPVSVTGGDYDNLYLTGTYNANAAVKDDNAECYISGGHFGEVAGAAQEQIGNNTTTKGNVRWQIYNADIDDFFGGGINDAKPVKGSITTEIFNSRVGTFCGGPKFGNMNTNKTVTTTAEGCIFDQFFGAGYGGNSYSRKKYYDKDGDQDWTTLQNYYISDRGKYYDGAHTNSQNGGASGSSNQYGYKGPGVGTDFDYEFFVWSSGKTGARFFVKFISFSLAQCNDVNSTLNRCTINGNFYGGGSLGKVVGASTSVLDECTVIGNVFGAGYSATLPTIQVRDAGFVSFPKYNSSSGMFEPGVFSGTTEFTWKQVDSYPSEGGAGFDGTKVITTQNTDKSNLGSVSGEVTLTLKGNTEVMGNVYGGGDESYVSNTETPANAKTTVILEGNTNVHGNVYGGGNKGEVSGNSEVIIHDTRTPGK